MTSGNFDFKPYDKYLEDIGFGEYMIDFSDISDSDALKICEFIKKLVEERRNNNESNNKRHTKTEKVY